MKRTTKEQENFIINNYSDYGFEYCMEGTGLTRTKVSRTARKFKLKLSKDLAWKLKSEAMIKEPDAHKVCHLPFENIKREEEAYILGLLWTDGHVSKTKNTVLFTTTRPDNDYFENIFNKTGTWNIFRDKNKKKDSYKLRVQLTTNNKFLRDFLAENGFTEKEKGLDRILKRIPEKFLPAFFAGLVDGDGCFYFSKEMRVCAFSLCSCFEQNWDGILSILHSKNIKYHVYKHSSPHGSSSKIYIYGCKFISLFGQFIYNNTNFGLPRKKAKFLKIEEKYKFPPPRKRRCHLP